MIYIDGYGYVDNSIYETYKAGSVRNSSGISGVSDIVTKTFESILETEKASLDSKTKTYNLNDIFREASEKYGISEDLLKAVAYNESRFKSDAISSVGAMGIMQLMPATAKSLGVEDAYDPYQNIMGGAKLLKQLSDMYDGNEKLMLAAYNAGPGNVEKYGGIPPFEETKNYVENVLATLRNGINTDGIIVSARTYTGNSIYGDSVLWNSVAGSTGDKYTYEEYKLLMTYFEQMLDIIQSMGGNDEQNNDEGDDSLTDLFRLGATYRGIM